MPAADWDIEIEENVQFDFYVTKKDDNCVSSDVTGYGAKFQVRATRSSSATILYTATVGSGVTVQPSAVPGLFHIILTYAQVNAPGAAWTKAFFDFMIWPGGGSETDQVKKLVTGRATWMPAASHP